MTSVLFILSVTFLETANTVLAPHNTFSQVSGVASIGFTVFFVRGGRELFHPPSPRMVLKPCSSVYANAMIAQYVVKKILDRKSVV